MWIRPSTWLHFDSSAHLPVTPVQLMRPGGQNASCTVADFVKTSGPAFSSGRCGPLIVQACACAYVWNKAGLDVYAKSHTCITSSPGLFYGSVAKPGPTRASVSGKHFTSYFHSIAIYLQWCSFLRSLNLTVRTFGVNIVLHTCMPKSSVRTTLDSRPTAYQKWSQEQSE